MAVGIKYVIEYMTSEHSNFQCRDCDSNQNHQIAYYIFGLCILPHFAASVYLYNIGLKNKQMDKNLRPEIVTR